MEKCHDYACRIVVYTFLNIPNVAFIYAIFFA